MGCYPSSPPQVVTPVPPEGRLLSVGEDRGPLCRAFTEDTDVISGDLRWSDSEDCSISKVKP